MANRPLRRFLTVLGTAALAATMLTAPGRAAEPLAPLLGSAGADTIAGRYIVVLDANAPTAAAQQTAVRAGGTVTATYTAALHGFAAALSPTALAAVRAQPGVKYVEADAWTTATADPQLTAPIWNLDRIDQHALPLDGAYAYRKTGAGVTAYVIDTGIYLAQPDFEGRASYGYDFVDNDPNANDCNGHGTHVAGTIASLHWGVANKVHDVAVRVLNCDGRGPASQVISGVDWVTQHAHHPAVANMSLGGKTVQAMDDAVTASIASGITYSIAAGNDHTDACTQSPARTPNAMTVGATDRTDKVAGFSNQGSCLDLFAPGVAIRSTYPADTDITAIESGTSMAAPHVAGVAAIYLAAHPSATPAAVMRAIMSGTTRGALTGVKPNTANRLLFVVS